MLKAQVETPPSTESIAIKKNVLSSKVKKESKEEESQFSDILAGMKNIEGNILAFEPKIQKSKKVEKESFFDDVSRETKVNTDLLFNLKSDTIQKVNSAKIKLKNILVQIKDIDIFKDIKSIDELVTFANKKGLNVSTLTLSELKDAMNPKPIIKHNSIDKTEIINTKVVNKDKASISKKVTSNTIKTKQIINQTKIATLKEEKNNPKKVEKKTKKVEKVEKVEQNKSSLENIIKTISNKKREPKIDKNLSKNKVVIETKDIKQAPTLSTKIEKKESAYNIQKESLKLKNNTIFKIEDEHIIKEQKSEPTIFQKSELPIITNSLITSLIKDRSRVTTKPNHLEQRDFKIPQKEIMSSPLTLENLLSSEKIVRTMEEKEAHAFIENIEKEISIEQKLEKLDTTMRKDDLSSKIPKHKEVFKNFSQEIRDKIDNYKPPIMKMAIELRPYNLGKVEVTLISRGDKLSISINSNTNAINLIMQNMNDFKVSLSNAGIDNVSMNFDSQSNKDNNKDNHNNGSNNKHTKDESIEENEHYSEVDTIEIVVPKYT